ncbi:DUF4396 domain-containing protein [Acuticoccus sp. M5D2P5]|uniref:DUF4396 domain-containing protein n=1 Tax=Acuticoccus kalidii TaxID=2910977 RepID=UPI001F23E929|nr:DUF4396 domain-containing protein [Acuticoccus kalidii]MCF3935658.1 DUF4396 domain-containing protein [Acuticoccus kalidii]
MPPILHALALLSLGLACLSALFILADVVRRPQPMWIMNVVWPVIALFSSLAGVWFYWRHGRAMPRGVEGHHHGDTPFPVAVAKGTLHCGAGCTLGDIVAELVALAVPGIAVVFGYQLVFSERIFAIWAFDFVLAFAFGIAFQFFTIAPMRGLGLVDGLIAALKADALSLTAWQIGMYGVMALAHFWFFAVVIGVPIDASMPEFWFAMQIAMIAGFATSYPANWFLLKVGLKEAM